MAFTHNNRPALRYTPVYWPVATLSVGVVLGISVQLAQAVLWQTWVYMLICAAALLLLCGFAKYKHAAFCVAGAALLAFGSTGWRACHYAQNGILAADLQRKSIVVEGHIVGLPQWQPESTRFVFAVKHATLNGQTVQLPKHISLSWYARDGKHRFPPNADEAEETLNLNNPALFKRCTACLRPGEQWRFTVRLRQPHGSRNPFGFDYERWLWEQGLGATGYVRTGKNSKNNSDEAPQHISPASHLNPRFWRDTLRLHARESVYQQLATPTTWSAAPSHHQQQRIAGIIAALLMGDQRAIEQADWDIFRTTGISHLVSISGLHITLFAWLAAGAVGALWRLSARRGMQLCLWLPAPIAALWGGMVLATAYAWFSGWGIPAQRTSLMLLIVALLRTKGLQWPWWVVLLLAAATVTLFDPWALLQPGFWLSFVAVGVLFSSSLQQTPKHPLPIWQKLLSGIKGFVRTQIIITLVLAPLTLLLFGQVSVVGLIANAVAVPLVTFIITPLTFLGTLTPLLWLPAARLMQLLMVFLEWLCSFHWASYQTAMPPLWVGVAGLIGGLLLVLRLPLAWRLSGALCLLPVLLWQAPRPAHGQFDLIAADVGQGSAILVRTHKHSLLFDAGPQYGAKSNAGQRVLLPLLAALNEQPHLLVLSHQDSDHIGGANAILQAYPHMQVQGSIAHNHALQQLRAISPCINTQQWQWDGVHFEFLHPFDEQTGSRGDNAASCVLRISNGTRSVLLSGDIGTRQERQMIAHYADTPHTLQADVLLVAHHGSKTSTGAAWLQAVQPSHAIIQQGYLNSYGHPHTSVLKRLQASVEHIHLSESCGAAHWQSSTNAVRCERKAHQRYWQHRINDAP